MAERTTSLLDAARRLVAILQKMQSSQKYDDQRQWAEMKRQQMQLAPVYNELYGGVPLINTSYPVHVWWKRAYQEASDALAFLEANPEFGATATERGEATAMSRLVEQLHPKVAERCRVPFNTGEYDTAMFNAVKVVEEEIRARIGGSPEDIGVGLVSKAMSSNEPRLVLSTVQAEQEAAHSLYRGAVGFLKNPHSHRFLDTEDPWRTFEAMAFASLLMRMLDEAVESEGSADTGT